MRPLASAQAAYTPMPKGWRTYALVARIEPTSGAERWKQRGFGKGSLLVADGHLWVLSDDGLLALVEVAPGGYREKARAQVLQGKTWTMPTLAGKRLYLRSERELVALDVAG